MDDIDRREFRELLMALGAYWLVCASGYLVIWVLA